MDPTVTLTSEQKLEVEQILRRFHRHFTSIPGLCVNLEYEFYLVDHIPVAVRERPIPFAMRDAVRQQTDLMLKHRIIEPATSPCAGPLLIVPRTNKAPRICVDARRVNALTVADSERTRPMHEMLQQFNGVKLLSSLNLTAAFLRVQLKESCQKYIAFLFDSKLYKFRRMALKQWERPNSSAT